MTQQDDIIQRLRDNADIDEAEHGNARVVLLEREAADEIERLRGELSKLRAPVAGEAQKPVAWMLVGRLRNSDPKFTLADPAGIYESVYAPLYAAPQASAEYERGHADGWAAGWDQAIKQPQADKNGGQQLVPIEPTHAMLQALSGEWHSSKHEQARSNYSAMLKAVPVASAPVADERAQDVDLPWLRAYMHHQIASDRWVVTADQARDFARAAVLADRQQRAGDADEGRLMAAAKGMTRLYSYVWDRTDGCLVVFPENVSAFDAAFDALRMATGEAVDDAPQAEQGERDAD